MIKTVSLETAKALKEAGFRQEMHFYWRCPTEFAIKKIPQAYANYEPELIAEKWSPNPHGAIQPIAAPTTDELLEELPEIVKFFIDCPGASLSIQFTSDRTYFCYYAKHLNHIAICHSELNESLPEALAQMWLWLKKENLLTNRKE